MANRLKKHTHTSNNTAEEHYWDRSKVSIYHNRLKKKLDILF